MSDFEIKSSSRMLNNVNNSINPEIVSSKGLIKDHHIDTMVSAVANNFDSILKIASDIIEIQKMKEQSRAVVAQLEAQGDLLIKEAKAYVMKKESETNEVINKMEAVRLMMRDFYEHAPSNLSGEEFSNIITKFIDKLDNI